LPADGGGALLAERPEDRIGDVRLARAVRPTITLTPGENVSRVRSGKDLKPFRLMAFRYMALARVAGRRMLALPPDAIGGST